MENDKWRLFIGIELPAEVCATIAKVQKMVGLTNVDMLRWVKPTNVHITLKFIGYFNRNRVQLLHECLTKVAIQATPFEIVTKAVLFLPTTQHVRTVCIGIDTTPNLLQVKQVLDRELNHSVLGIQADTRVFRPHITFGRIRRDAGLTEMTKNEIEKACETTGLTQIKWKVNQFGLYRSILHRIEPQYICFEYYSLS